MSEPGNSTDPDGDPLLMTASTDLMTTVGGGGGGAGTQRPPARPGNDGDDEMDELEMRYLSFFAYGVVGPMIIVVGLFGNGMTLRTFLGRTPLWSNGMTYTYLKWLAITDTGSLIMAIPMEVRLSMPWRRLPYWEAFYQAHLELPVLNSFMGSSIFIVVCLTGTRFLALFQPAKYRTVVSKSTRAQLAVFLAVILAILLSAPLVMLKQVACEDPPKVPGGASGSLPYLDNCKAKENTDITNLNEWKAFVVVSEGVVRVLPVVTLTILNAAMIVKFRSVARRRRAISSRSNSRADAARAEERRKLILLSTIIVLFICFNSPSAVLSIIYTESWETRRGFQVFRALSNDMELANFAVNFYAYFLCSKDFRQAFFDSLPERCGLAAGAGSRRRRSRRRRAGVAPGRGRAFLPARIRRLFGSALLDGGRSSGQETNGKAGDGGDNNKRNSSDGSVAHSGSFPSLRTEIERNSALVGAQIIHVDRRRGSSSDSGDVSSPKSFEAVAVILPMGKLPSLGVKGPSCLGEKAAEGSGCHGFQTAI